MPFGFQEILIGGILGLVKNLIPRVPLGEWLANRKPLVSFGILQNRSSICGLRAKKCSGYCVTSAGIGYCSMSLRSCDWFRNQDFFTSSLRSSDGRFQLPVLSPLAGRHSHYVLGHTLSETYGFLPLPQPCMNPLCREERKAYACACAV